MMNTTSNDEIKDTSNMIPMKITFSFPSAQVCLWILTFPKINSAFSLTR